MKTKRVVALLLAVVMCLVMMPITQANAASQTQTPKSGNYVRIRYAGNGRYVDVPAEGIDNNGTQLQLWEFAYGNQNQIFRLIKSGNSWQIISAQSGKVIEVRDSSHDDYAQVAQWEKHSLECAKWDIIKNSDGTVSFRNCESGKYLNVYGGGDASNGTKLIQYHDDGTIAMKFYIDVMGYSDVLAATYESKLTSSSMSWTQYNPVTSYTVNDTGWQIRKDGNSYYPTVGQKIFVSAEYLSPNTVANLLKEKSYSKSIWNQIGDALSGELPEEAISKLLGKLGYDNIPGIGVALGILQAVSDSRDAEKWNRFVDAAKIDAQGRCSGVIIYTYQTIVDVPVRGYANNGTTAIVTWHHIRKTTSAEYASWTGDNFWDVTTLPVSNTSGGWYFSFK